VIDVPKSNGGVVVFTHIPAPLDLTPGDYDAPVFSLGGQDDYAFRRWPGDCYTSNHDKNEAASTNNDLWIVPVTGGPAKNITADNPASDSTPLYSPDGRYIAYRAQQRPGYESDQFQLMTYERSTGKKKVLPVQSRIGLVLHLGTRFVEDLFVSNHQEGADEGQMNVVWSTRSRPIRRPLPENLRKKGLQPIGVMAVCSLGSRLTPMTWHFRPTATLCTSLECRSKGRTRSGI